MIHALTDLFPLCIPLALGHQVRPPGVGHTLQGLGIMYRAEAVLQEDTILQSQAKHQESLIVTWQMNGFGSLLACRWTDAKQMALKVPVWHSSCSSAAGIQLLWSMPWCIRK